MVRVRQGAFVMGQSETGGDHARNGLAGLAYAAAGFALLSCGDTIVKTIADEWPGTAIAALRYVFGAIGLGGLLLVRNGRSAFICPQPWIQIGRGASVALGSACFFLALANMSIAEATVIQFASPIIVALLSALLYREKVGLPTWAATAIAFAGVVIVIRPNLANVGMMGLLPLGTAIFMAGLVLFNRKSAGTMTALQAQVLISAFAAPMLVAIALAGHVSGVGALHVAWPSMIVIAKCAIVACSASLAHALIYMATERVSAATMAPVTYIQLLVAIVLGALFFGHVPDTPVYLGGALVIGAGLILWWNATAKGKAS
jgi:drug/metabolite transporter (DMT)-like permease